MQSEPDAHDSGATAGAAGATRIRVSVVVPVFEPGESFDDLIASLDAQTLAQDRFEVLLCDDGSGPETQERLQRIASTRPAVRVQHLPHSGWPGTPRNHGIDSARGTYVQFVDQDDRLFPDALQRLCDYADEHGSDVVVGKEVGIGRPLPRRIFRRDVPRARLGTDPLLEMLTPHKMFRTAFLREHGIRFPDGRVRLEDHLFVMRAYFEADVISILASTPCYAWVKHPGSASAKRIDPATYFPHLEAVLDLVEAHTEPGALRDRLLSHWLGGKILKRLSGRQMARYPEAYRERFLDVVEPLVDRRFAPSVDAELTVPHRIRAALLRAGRRDDLLELARFEHGARCHLDVASAAWSRGGGLQLRLQLRESDGDAWRGPAWLDELAASVLGRTKAAAADRVELLVTRADEVGPGRTVAGGTLDRRGRGSLALDPLAVFARADDAEAATIVARVRRAGVPIDATLVVDDAIVAAAGGSPLLAGSATTLATTADGDVELRRRSAGGLRDLAGRAVRRARRASKPTDAR